MDKAFCFYYAAMFDEFRQNGAEVVFFSPMAELRMWTACTLAVSELYPCELETSATTKSLKDLSADGMPIYGEWWITTSFHLYEIDNVVYKMADIFPARTVLTKKLHIDIRKVTHMGHS